MTLRNMATPTTPPASVPGRSQVLIVDDDRINQLLYATILRKAGFDVVTAAIGRDALALTAARSFDLVLLDLMMPEMLGTEVARRMRAQPGMGDVPIFLLTASSDKAHVEEGFQAGIDEYLVKPVDRAILVATVRSALAALAARRALQPQRGAA
jgi:two-component system sensor histidine kinase ChiS